MVDNEKIGYCYGFNEVRAYAGGFLYPPALCCIWILWFRIKKYPKTLAF